MPIPPRLSSFNASKSKRKIVILDRPDIWGEMQYLPNLIKDEKFYIPSYDSKMEQSLNQNYLRLQKIKRTTIVARLRKLKKED